MQRPPRVSFNIPIFNGERTIALAVQSALDQTFPDVEVIVVNDCSKDKTAQVLNAFTDPRLTVIHHERNQGISRTRNDALKASTGEFVAILDGDDFALPRRAQAQLDAMAADPARDGVFSCIRYYNQGTDPYKIVAQNVFGDEPAVREKLLFENPFPHSTAFLKRSVLGAGYPEDLPCAEDYAKWLELVFAGRKLQTLADPVSHGGVHPPTSYTRASMREAVGTLHARYFEKILGRPLIQPELDRQWALYETVEWTPATADEALEQLRAIKDWIRTIEGATLEDATWDRARFSREAHTRLYQLCSRALKRFALKTAEFAPGMTAEQRLKLFVKGLLGPR